MEFIPRKWSQRRKNSDSLPDYCRNLIRNLPVSILALLCPPAHSAPAQSIFVTAVLCSGPSLIPSLDQGIRPSLMLADKAAYALPSASGTSSLSLFFRSFPSSHTASLLFLQTGHTPTLGPLFWVLPLPQFSSPRDPRGPTLLLSTFCPAVVFPRGLSWPTQFKTPIHIPTPE